MYCVVQIGSRMLRLECGTTRSTLSCALAPKATNSAAKRAKRRMRESPAARTRGRLTGHGTHRNRRLSARDERAPPREGGGTHRARGALVAQPGARDGNHRARGYVQHLRPRGNRRVAGGALLLVPPRQGGPRLPRRQADECRRTAPGGDRAADLLRSLARLAAWRA